MTLKVKISLFCLVMALTCCIKRKDTVPRGDALGSFDQLWKIVDEQYCYLDYKKVNWDSIRVAYEPRALAAKDDRELFKVFSDMLAELKDGHVNLVSPFNTFFYSDWYLDYPPNFNTDILERSYLGDDYSYINGLVFDKYNDVGYLRCGTFMNWYSVGNISNGLKNIGPMKGLIIDMRNNGGGYVAMAELLASCFIDGKKMVGYNQYRLGPGHGDFSGYYPVYVEGVDPVLFQGNIIVLTNRSVYSAGNEFVNYIKGQKNVKILGDKTGGGGGVPLASELPNGWQVRLSRNPTYDVQKNHIELGIDPDQHLDMKKSDEMKEIDTILEEAIFQLSGLYFKK